MHCQPTSFSPSVVSLLTAVFLQTPSHIHHFPNASDQVVAVNLSEVIVPKKYDSIKYMFFCGLSKSDLIKIDLWL